MSGLIGVIHVAKNQLGMDDDTYRSFLTNVVGKDSCAKMSRKEQWQVLEELKRRGFQKQSTHKGRELPNDGQARKIRSLWLTMADHGIIRNRSEQALERYVTRITGRTLKTASVKQCQAVIETLKKWLDRCDDPDIRKRCLAVLRGDDDAPPVLDGKAVAAASAVYQ